MSIGEIPSELPIAMDGACTLAVECWRLKRASELTRDASTKAALRHAVRRLAEALQAIGIEAIDFAGRPYDPGMVPEVVEVREALELSDHPIVEETVTPTITWREQVVSPGQIVVRRAGGSPAQSSEVYE